MRSLTYSANPFVPPPLKFPHNVMAGAIGVNAGKVLVKNQPTESDPVPKARLARLPDEQCD